MNVPERIDLDSRAHTLTLHWPDAPAQCLSDAALRRECPCAACRRIRLTAGFVQAAEDVKVVDIHSMAYGVQLIFSDGHGQGIFPWQFLEELGTTLE
ncbi:gamma-butyrobetaine hydroxylase-like domain-containing protein [Caballeronia sp. DA-9]|uniref:gamma-butyrobetaine hydroxylase-like domain-containing protein n=1 Tax=Caballeronia sp. DA-9 TaxID=3436237 RepID=UPI003F675BE3